MAGTQPLPRCKALLACDQVLVEAVTGRISLIGILDRVLIDEFPTQFPRCQVFLLLTDGYGEYDIAVEVHDLSDNSVIAQIAEVTAEIHDRLVRWNLIVPVPAFEVLNPGTFDFVLLANEQEILRQSVEMRDRDDLQDEWQQSSE
jgi:Family of unknown function (DUF6941)